MPRREFPAKVKVAAFERAGGHCERCTVRLSAGRIEYDHIVPDWLGGEPTLDNCAVLCTACHRGEGGKTAEDAKAIARAKRVKRAHIGAAPKSKRPLPGGRSDRMKHKIGGGWVPRCEE